MARQRWVVLAFVLAHVLAAGHVFFATHWDRSGMVTGDNRRYHEIAHAPGLAYRDHEVEYPPLTAAFIDIVAAPSDLNTGGRILVVTQLIADFAVTAALAWGWDRRVALAWLALFLPLLWDGWVFARVDLLASALAVFGVAMVRRGGQHAGGLLVGLGALAKLYPALLVPGFVTSRRRDAALAAVVTIAAGAAVWLVIGGTAGFRQVLTFRCARGWQVESTIGALVLAFTDARVDSESGALRVGTAPGWAKGVLLVMLVGVLAAAWLAERGAGPRRAEPYGAIVMIGALMLLSPVLSPQYLVWILPFIAIVWSDRLLTALTASAVVMSAWVAHRYRFVAGRSPELLWIMNLRNAALIAVVAVAAARLSASDAACRARRTPRSRSRSDRSSTPGSWDHAAP